MSLSVSNDPALLLETLQKKVVHASEQDINTWKNELERAKTVPCASAKVTPPTVKDCVETIVRNKASNKYLFSILLTAAVKKIVDPKIDIRRAQDNMKGGYSNRSLDQRIVTPFLKKYDYTHCEASGLESGRNMERPIPWDLKYPTNPRGQGNKEAFLGTLNFIQTQAGSPETVSLYLLFLDRSSITTAEATTAPPLEQEISKIMRVFERHFSESSGQGRSRLPVLALYAIYSFLINELSRYMDASLLPLERHTTADLRSGSIGDIQLNIENDPFEGIEVKSDKPITVSMINELPRKFGKSKVSRYYILTTFPGSVLEDEQELVKTAVKLVQERTGTQIIVNGLISSLRYYLRLLEDPSSVLGEYQELLNKDQDIRPELITSWNKIIQEEYSS